jgi:DNA-binding response OmpR family regulator
MSLIEKFIPDMLFLDLNMPYKNGVECIMEIREIKAYDSLPIVVFTISSQVHAIQTAYGFGANLYFVKPTNLSLLVPSLQKILTMDWRDPRTITARYFQNNQYLPFEAA